MVTNYSTNVTYHINNRQDHVGDKDGYCHVSASREDISDREVRQVEANLWLLFTRTNTLLEIYKLLNIYSLFKIVIG